MSEQKLMQSEYSNLMKNQKCFFCHTMDMSHYKILCEDFYANPQNKKHSLKLAEEANFLFLESEDEFLHWLELE